ncbi:MAG TPA: YajG family lipoprotein [Burkholderiales bacterium]|nr:YajG family lipoprotein [Burkholderiales bacterium]
MKTTLWLLPLLLALLAGCALKPQYLRIDPQQIRVAQSQAGAGQTVALQVTDARTEKKLGEVGDPDNKMVDVSVEEDPAPKIYARVKEALERMGFTVQPYVEGAEPALKLEVRKLELQSVKTPFTFETELRAEVAAHASRENGHYDRQFNVRTRKDGAAPPYEKDSNALVNTAVSQALEDLLADEQLIATLAR